MFVEISKGWSILRKQGYPRSHLVQQTFKYIARHTIHDESLQRWHNDTVLVVDRHVEVHKSAHIQAYNCLCGDQKSVSISVQG
jgi:hypothetical protein